MKIKASDPIVDLKGEAIKDLTIGLAIGNILTNSQIQGKMKLFVLAKKFANDKNVELDEADRALVKEAIEQSTFYNVLVTGQLLVMLLGGDK